MTNKTPLEEAQERLAEFRRTFGIDAFEAAPRTVQDYTNIAIELESYKDRTTLIKAIWAAAAPSIPQELMHMPDGLLLEMTDPWGGQPIHYERITYGGKTVIEAEGVVVWYVAT